MSAGAVESGGRIEAAVRRASRATGVDFDFLMRTARRESGLNPKAKAPTSSAAGLFQFVEQTWLAMVKRHGAKHGYGQAAAMIDRGTDGRLRIAGEARRAVLNLRYDPQAASLMAAELASDHAAYLRGRIGREPKAGELYAAHFLGPAGSAKLIEAVERSPGARAAGLFPEAAAANRSIFYRDGRASSVADLYANLTRTGGHGAAVGVPERTPPAEPTAGFTTYAGGEERYERLSRERMLLDLMLGSEGAKGGGPFEAQLLAAFADEV